MIAQARTNIWNGLKQYHGAIQDLVERTSSLKEGGYTRYHVYQVLAGRRNNLDILTLASQVLKEYQTKHEQQLARLQQFACERA